MNVAIRDAEPSAWVRAHEALSQLAKARALADAEEGRCLLAALRSAAHVHLGFSSFGEYVERLFGYGRRCTQEKLRVAEALEALPLTARALEDGALNWSGVRELTRVAVAETEHEWIEVARAKTVRQLEELVAGKSPGDGPDSSSQPSTRRHVLRFEVAPETFAAFREAVAELRRRSASSLNDDALLLEMARCVLGGPQDEGRASYQVALSACAQCGTARQEANGELVSVGPEIAAMADCDGQHLGCVDMQPANDGGAHVGARAKQTIPPATRRAVLRRDQRRCRVPGCSNATFLDLHHIELRSEGGNNRAQNLISVCAGHHRALHRGELCVEGDADAQARFRHADGSAYGEPMDPRALDTYTKTFGALRGLGFRESDVRRVLAELRNDAQLREANVEGWLRAALYRLTPPAAR